MALVSNVDCQPIQYSNCQWDRNRAHLDFDEMIWNYSFHFIKFSSKNKLP